MSVNKKIWTTIIGPPGSEARFFASILSTRFSVPFLSVYNAAIVERIHRTFMGLQLQEMQAGQHWPSHLVGQLVQAPLQRASQTGTGLIAANFPRDFAQWQMLRSFAPPFQVISLTGSRKELEARIKQRRVCATCDMPMYPQPEVTVKATVAAVTGQQMTPAQAGQTFYTHIVETGCVEVAPVRVESDEGASLKMRWENYEKLTMPMLTDLRAKRLTDVHEIPISNEPDEMWKRILQVFGIYEK